MQAVVKVSDNNKIRGSLLSINCQLLLHKVELVNNLPPRPSQLHLYSMIYHLHLKHLEQLQVVPTLKFTTGCRDLQLK